MQQTVYLKEDDNRPAGFWLSLIFHILLLFLLLIPCFNMMQKQPPEQRQGIIVAFGNPDSEIKSNPRKSQKSHTSTKKTSSAVKAQPKKTAPKKTTPSKSVAKKVVSETTSSDEVITATKKKAKEDAKMAEVQKENEARLKAEKQAAERRKREEEAKAREEAEAKRKAEEKSKAKSKFSSLFGKGNEDASDSKGQENGKPNASALDGLSTGSGKVGDGLGERGTLFIPKIQDNTQKTGRVVVRICVNQDGKVISANYTQKGSTTTDAHLISVAEKNAKKYKFTKSKIVEQCGNIVIDFKLK